MDKVLLILVIFATFFLSLALAEDQQQCVKQDACHCQINEFSRIDISKLTDTHLEDTLLSARLTYYFFGCSDTKKDGSFFGLNSTNISYIGSLFLFNQTNKNVTVLGTTKNMQFEFIKDNNNYELVYKVKDNITAYLTLTCDHTNPSYIKIIDQNSNRLVLSSPHACILKEPHTTSTGSVLVIIFVVGCMVYFIGGALMLYFLRGARGIELVPNIEFWRELPGLIRDGTIFLFSGCRPTYVSTAETYDRI
ncbi:unnamed protein product [Brassicogethes aeneus]|uniref:Cation-dependent mannose-6-phosphate receptor n=1 Tax=Brassicogethes aeneus TaxID=1431903 RepID=A0A9P0FP44_BRAAE|nr:unnamed protein product [Brassicogethes aeneus]